jgi:HlyD family secretion protein
LDQVLATDFRIVDEHMDTKVNTTTAVPIPASNRLAKPLAFIKGHSKVLGAIALLLLAGALAFVWWSRKDAGGDYLTDKVTRGTIEVNVSATGTVQAVTTVQVGSQVSGSVSWLGADFKSRVTRGQVVAKLDPALFQAQVDTARANVMNAQAGVQAALTEIQNQTANVEATKANDRASAAARDDAISIAKQNEKLKGVIPDRDIEAAQNAAKAAIARYSQATSQIGQATAQLQISQAKLKQAQAAVAQAQAQLAQASVNLEHTVITSPIDGVVVSRTIDVGQTVAASLSAPTLFTIANDLTNMQVLASIDEADVGQIKEGGKARFTVDAFPNQTFNGDLIQVRLNSQTLQNVVTYTAVINVANPEQKLMPGMTANITIPVARRDDVLRVPNAALRFKPELTEQQQKDVQAKIEKFRQEQQAQSSNEPDTQKGPAAPTEGEAQAPPTGNADSGTERRGNRRGEGAGHSTSGQGANANVASEGGRRRHQATDAGDKTGADNSNSNAQGTPRRHRQQEGGGNDTKHQDSGKAPTDRGSENRGGKKKDAAAAESPKPSPSPSPSSTSGGNQGGAGGGRRGSGGQRQIVAVWVLTAAKTLDSRIVRTGITDGRFTEIVAGDLKEGDIIVTALSDAGANNNRTQTTTPFQQQRPPGAGGGRGR